MATPLTGKPTYLHPALKTNNRSGEYSVLSKMCALQNRQMPPSTTFTSTLSTGPLIVLFGVWTGRACARYPEVNSACRNIETGDAHHRPFVAIFRTNSQEWRPSLSIPPCSSPIGNLGRQYACRDSRMGKGAY